MHPVLRIENVRCFADLHRIPLAPLTFFVGENSAGKSTAMGMAKFMATAIHSPAQLSLNEQPFMFGNFNDIVHTFNNRTEDTFSVGYELPAITNDNRHLFEIPTTVTLRLTFVGRDAQPHLAQWEVTCRDYSINVEIQSATDASRRAALQVTVSTPNHNLSTSLVGFPGGVESLFLLRDGHFFSNMLLRSESSLFNPEDVSAPPIPETDRDVIESMLSVVTRPSFLRGPIASAPIRTKPRRSYDPIAEKQSPEGDHIPLLLAKLSAKENASWKKLHKKLKNFGTESGMFADISVRRFSKKDASAPFQVRVKSTFGDDFNLLDVGYGVSQVLPILVDATQSTSAPLLLQQPEVHLHPKAQAELGSFFADLATHRGAVPVLIETHSDYIIDRVRADIRDDRTELKAEDVRIVYFSRSDGSVSCHDIRIDDNGNLIDPPAEYRHFFIDETRRILGA